MVSKNIRQERSISNEDLFAAIVDLHEAMSLFSTHVDSRFQEIETKMVTKEELKESLEKVLAGVVTKDYLDEKLADLRGDIVLLLRKEDEEVTLLVDTLHTSQVLSQTNTQKILSLSPFPERIVIEKGRG